MTNTKNPHLIETRVTLHKWLSLSTGIVLLFFCFLNFVLLYQNAIALVDGVFGVLNLYFFYKANQGRMKRWHNNMLILSLASAVLYAFYFADIRAGAVYWLLVLPPLFCLLLGAKRGLFCTILLSFPAIWMLFSKSDTQEFIPYRSVLNFVLAYFLAYMVCYFYENQYTTRDKALQKMAFQDPLTGAKNRHALELFFEYFNKQAIDPFKEKAQEPHLLIIDIDFFKSVNDEFGHDVGDSVLVEITELLHYYADKQQVYRIGGEEFLIVLQDYSSSEAFSFAERIRRNIENSVFLYHEQDIKITVSIGIAQLKKGQTFKEFFKVADKNLYSAKNKGRNLVHHEMLTIAEQL
ncbi:GGDEF domain-containing protein [Marinomonas foliarum]|uniref:diguanylate cyclase n=1 Tax=Marinomonas foliarum TaxID=491950 RepID=A0ABX7IL84_9GAMM|nr:diguanylate cyclase [Marinomonas foliarum]QRV22960.1 diguanylate cyclase [Marinomonas foliarum]